nr:hypothetical protein CFP56_40855 [Quercus suber]
MKYFPLHPMFGKDFGRLLRANSAKPIHSIRFKYRNNPERQRPKRGLKWFFLHSPTRISAVPAADIVDEAVHDPHSLARNPNIWLRTKLEKKETVE